MILSGTEDWCCFSPACLEEVGLLHGLLFELVPSERKEPQIPQAAVEDLHESTLEDEGRAERSTVKGCSVESGRARQPQYRRTGFDCHIETLTKARRAVIEGQRRTVNQNECVVSHEVQPCDHELLAIEKSL